MRPSRNADGLESMGVSRVDGWTHRWTQEARYWSMLLFPIFTTVLISFSRAWFWLSPAASSSSPTKSMSSALPRDRKDGRFSTVNSGCEGRRLVVRTGRRGGREMRKKLEY